MCREGGEPPRVIFAEPKRRERLGGNLCIEAREAPGEECRREEEEARRAGHHVLVWAHRVAPVGGTLVWRAAVRAFTLFRFRRWRGLTGPRPRPWC